MITKSQLQFLQEFLFAFFCGFITGIIIIILRLFGV